MQRVIDVMGHGTAMLRFTYLFLVLAPLFATAAAGKPSNTVTATAEQSSSSVATTAGESSTPVGVWLLSTGRIKMKISPCGDALCAKLVWFKSPNDAEGKPRVDEKNPDPTLRERALLGLTVLHGLRPNAEGAWEGGEVYNPDDGDTYSAEMSIEEDGTLRVRGYVIAPLLGKTLTWTRVK